MKKRLVIASLILSLMVLSIFSISLVSAGFFDWLKQITGKVITDPILSDSFEGTSLGTLYDSIYVEGKIGNGVNLGSNGYVKYSPTYLNLPSGTIEFWIKRIYSDNDNKEHTFFYFLADSSNAMKLYKSQIGNLGFLLYTPQGQKYVIVGNADGLLTNRQWVKLSVTWDSQALKLYINDELKNTTLSPTLPTKKSDLYLGRAASDYKVSADSVIDEFKIYNYAKSYAQCIENWQCGEWLACVNGQQTRTCTDLNNCGTTNNKPDVLKTCTETEIDGCAKLSDEVKAKIDEMHGIGKVTLKEGEKVYWNQYVVIPGYILQVEVIENLDSYTSDRVTLRDIITGEVYNAVITSEGSGTLTIGGKIYTLNYYGSSLIPERERYLTLKWNQGATETFYCSICKSNLIWTKSDCLIYVGDTVTATLTGSYKISIPSITGTYATISVNDNLGKIAEGTSGIIGGLNIYIKNAIENTEMKSYARLNLSQATGTCTDSDGGINYYVRGEVKAPNIFDGWDSCVFEQIDSEIIPTKKLNEMYCDGGKGMIKEYKCPNGCEDGACIQGEGCDWRPENIKDGEQCSLLEVVKYYFNGKECKEDGGCAPFSTLEECKENCEEKPCQPTYSCTISPLICPSTGTQTKTCKDIKCDTGKEYEEEEIKCNPGECAGCELGEYSNTRCIPYGFRAKINNLGNYCDIDGQLYQQKPDWQECQNHYECESNFCSGGECTGINRMLQETGKWKAIAIQVICTILHPVSEDNRNTCIANLLNL